MEPLLEIRGLCKTYRRGGQETEALREVSFAVPQGICLGIVGESGCGKSTLCRLMAGLERPTAGQVLYRGAPLTPGKHSGRIQMVFQNSLDAVNLHMDALHILSEPLENFFHLKKAARLERAERLMELVGLPAADLGKYPRQFSGGQLQRICIARALAAEPELLLLDEPLSSLDVSVQAQLLNLLADLKQSLGLTCVLISHDLEAVYYLSDALLVLCGGSLMEQIDDIADFGRLRHPYTQRLLSAHSAEAADLPAPRAQTETRDGCACLSQCALAGAECRTQRPPVRTLEPGHRIACFQR